MTQVSPGLASELRRLVNEAVGSERMVKSEPYEGRGAVIINAPESNQALLWIRGPATDPRPALIQTMVPFDDRPIEVDDDTARAAVEWMAAQRGHWLVAEMSTD